MSKPKKKRTLTEFMGMMSKDLVKMQESHATETDPKRRAELEMNIRIRTAFVAKLRRQIDEHQPSSAATRSQKQGPRPRHASRKRAECWNGETVETFPGDDDYY